MDALRGAGGSPVMATLAVEPQPGLALLESPGEDDERLAAASRCVFEGIALGPGVYVDAAGRRVRVRAERLPLVAERMRGVFLRDLHREDLGASVGVVADARLTGEEVRFTGDVRMAPYVELVRQFWPNIRFSLGFRYDPAGLKLGGDGTYDLPEDFLIDHLALVPQGQYPNARLVRLLNQARGLTSTSPVVPVSGELQRADVSSGEHQRADVKEEPQAPTPTMPSPSPTPPEPAPSGEQQRVDVRESMQDETKELDELRQQRDDALKAADKSRKETEQARADLGKAQADLAAANKLAEAARLELGQAKNRFAADVMKLELAAGKDFDLDARKKELTALELGSLDRLRAELRAAAAETEEEDGRPEGTEPATRADPPAWVTPETKRETFDLSSLGFTDTLRLAFSRGVL